jgi:probable rRNA maturation factor
MPNPKSKIYSVAIANRQRAVRIDRRRLIRLARAVLEMEEVALAEISVAIVDDAEIRAINREFLNHDSPTDVISFLLDGDDAGGDVSQSVKKTVKRPPSASRPAHILKSPSRHRRRGSRKLLGGEIVISAETARRHAATYRVSPHDELALYLAHGILHLCGYDDRSPREKRLMRRRETEALAAVARHQVIEGSADRKIRGRKMKRKGLNHERH